MVAGKKIQIAVYLAVGLVFFNLAFRALSIPTHFSVWVGGDAQMYNAGKHFADEGFFVHHFLPLTNPGNPHSFILNNGPTGHYSHYPALHAIVNGLFIMAAHMIHVYDDIHIKAGLQVFYLTLVAIGVTFFGLTASRFYGPIVGTSFMLLIALSPWVTGFGDSFCDQPLNIFLMGLFFYFAVETLDSSRALKTPSLLLAATSFLISQNTIEMIPVVIIFPTIYGAVLARTNIHLLGLKFLTILLSVVFRQCLAYYYTFIFLIWNSRLGVSFSLTGM